MPYATPSSPPTTSPESSIKTTSRATSVAMKSGLRERSKSSDSINSINVMPPTPDRYNSSRSIHPPRTARPETSPLASSSSSNPTPRIPPSTHHTYPIPTDASTSSSTFHPTHATPQVLAQVRSPPKQLSTFDGIPDSLQLNPRRGRRPRLFGFTEMSENGGGSGSSSQTGSAANSRDSSPTNHHGTVQDSSNSDALMFFPRKQHQQHQQHRATGSWTAGQSIAQPLPPTPSGSNSPPVETIPTPTHLRPLPPSRVAAPPLRSALSTRTPAQRNEGALKLDLEGIASKSPSMTGPPTDSSTLDTPSVLIRKKSGEILKPSLKSSSSFTSDYGDALSNSSRSLPGTPSCPKYVHFDTQLEKVKLFLADQKPRAVSRDGSPTNYASTSEGEEFPFPATDEESDGPKRVQLEIRLPNFPTSQPLESDCFLESLFLDEDRKSLKGIVQVKNLSFQKWVAVRFTFDWWQTTSEVTATHKESIKGGEGDRFQFVLKLHDMLSKIEEKTLFLALRYTTDGKEIWDSNGGSNYQVVFVKVPVTRGGPTAARPGASTIAAGQGRSIGGKNSQWSLAGQQQDRLADLRHKLNTLSADDATERLPGIRDKFGAGGSNSPTRKGAAIGLWSDKGGDAPPLSPLSGRYDFGSALGSLGKGSPRFNGTVELPGQHSRGPSMEFYSPQLKTNDLYSPIIKTMELPGGPHPSRSVDSYLPGTPAKPNGNLDLPAPDLTIQEPSPPAAAVPADYFHVKAPSAVSGPILPKSAPRDASPTVSRTALPRMYSLPSKASVKTEPKPVADPLPPLPSSMINGNWFNSPMASTTEQFGSHFGNKPHLYGGDSNSGSSNEASPPSFSSSIGGSSSSNSSVSSASPQQGQYGQWSPPKFTAEDVGKMDYSSFLQQFCWGGAAALQHPGGLDIRRSHSTSDVDKFYSSGVYTDKFTPHAKHNSSDSIFSPVSSGAGTPTDSRNTTPVGSYFSKAINSGENLTPTNSSFLGSSSSRSTITPSSSLPVLPVGGYAQSPVDHGRLAGSPLLDAVSRSLASSPMNSPLNSPTPAQRRACVA